MADIQIKSGKRGFGKDNPRIDLTPMVDLGFLLITFFMMTTSMSKPKAMDIQMPFKPAPPESTIWYETSAITLLPAADGKVFYYEGMADPNKQLKVAGNELEVRNILLRKQRSIADRKDPDERSLQVLIKSHATATVDDVIGLFDEMNILQVKYFAMVDINAEENEMVNKLLAKR
jgi:biopolymer transport protein ExbD